MKSSRALKASLIGLGMAAVCGSLYYLFKKSKEILAEEFEAEEEFEEEEAGATKESPLSSEELVQIIQYMKYNYYPVLVGISKAVSKAKDQGTYNNTLDGVLKIKRLALPLTE